LEDAVNHESRRELEEMRILRTMETTCRNAGVVLHANFDVPPEGEDCGRTTAKFTYSRDRFQALAGRLSIFMASAGFAIFCAITVLWPYSWGAVLAGLASAYLITAMVATLRAKTITSSELTARIDADLIAAGFIVETTPTSWRVTIPDDTEGEEWKSPRGTSDA
jgi:hypothetical protein